MFNYTINELINSEAVIMSNKQFVFDYQSGLVRRDLLSEAQQSEMARKATFNKSTDRKSNDGSVINNVVRFFTGK